MLIFFISEKTIQNYNTELFVQFLACFSNCFGSGWVFQLWVLISVVT